MPGRRYDKAFLLCAIRCSAAGDPPPIPMRPLVMRLLIAAFAALVWCSSPALALDIGRGDPNHRVVEVISPTSAGSPRDTALRKLLEVMGKLDAKTGFIVDNSPGAERLNQKLSDLPISLQNKSCCLVALSYSDYSKLVTERGSPITELRFVSSLFIRQWLWWCPTPAASKT
jgi:hypothetical protein